MWDTPASRATSRMLAAGRDGRPCGGTRDALAGGASAEFVTLSCPCGGRHRPRRAGRSRPRHSGVVDAVSARAGRRAEAIGGFDVGPPASGVRGYPTASGPHPAAATSVVASWSTRAPVDLRVEARPPAAVGGPPGWSAVRWRSMVAGRRSVGPRSQIGTRSGRCSTRSPGWAEVPCGPNVPPNRDLIVTYWAARAFDDRAVTANTRALATVLALTVRDLRPCTHSTRRACPGEAARLRGPFTRRRAIVVDGRPGDHGPHRGVGAEAASARRRPSSHHSPPEGPERQFPAQQGGCS